MEALFRALPALLEALPDNEIVREAVVFAAWRKIAGEQLGAHTYPVGFGENRLTVAVPDRSWKKNLASLSSQMIFKINALLGSAVVTYIEFVIDADKLEGIREQTPRAAQNIYESENDSFAEIPPELLRSANVISDEKLRREFLRAAGNCLARKEKLAG